MKPPEKIPDWLLDSYSMNGLADIEYKYRDDSSEEIQKQILKNYSRQMVDLYNKKIANGQCLYYGKTDKWLYCALKSYPIMGKDVLVFGSAAPWYELIAVAYGAKTVDVLEFSPRMNVHDKVEYITDEYLNEYDVAISISSFEHYGLGRYGDPVGPDEDLMAMKKVRHILKDDGVLFLSVPIGIDKVYWNVHRVYGSHRFPLLTKEFEMVDSYGFDNNSFKRTDNNAKGTPYQPVFVLRKS